MWNKFYLYLNKIIFIYIRIIFLGKIEQHTLDDK